MRLERFVQLHTKSSQLWFVCLMIFIIGLSGVASTTVQANQSAGKQHYPSTTMPCHDAEMMDQTHQTHQMHMSHSDHEKHMKCDDQKMQNDLHCQDCNSPSHCQTANIGIAQPLSISFTSESSDQSLHQLPAYQARHLAGYWQEILRPPKT